MQKKTTGFSLIELLIVVAIILVVAAMAVPSLLRSRISANEASAVASLRSINTAEVAYSVAYPQMGYSDDLSKLKPPPVGVAPDSNSAGLLDSVLACAAQPCPKSGYQFAVATVIGFPVDGYTLTAVPITLGQTGVRGFCSDQLARMTYDPNGASACSSSLQ